MRLGLRGYTFRPEKMYTTAEGDTPPRLEVARLLSPLLCTRDAEYLPRGGYPVRLVVEEEKLRERTHSCVFSLERCHARCSSHAFRKGMSGPQLAFSASWGRATPASFNALPWERTPRVEAFPMRYFVSAAPLPKAVEWIPVPSEQQIAWYNG